MSIVPLINVTQSNHRFNRGKRKLKHDQNYGFRKMDQIEEDDLYVLAFGLLRNHYVTAYIWPKYNLCSNVP